MLVAKDRVVSHDLLVSAIQGRNEVLIFLGHSAVHGRCARRASRAGSSLLRVVVLVVAVVLMLVGSIGSMVVVG